MSDTDSTTCQTYQERMTAVAVRRMDEQAAERRRVIDLVLRPDRYGRTRCHVDAIIPFDGDFLVQVVDKDGATWTTVLNDAPGKTYFQSVEMAMLHLIARRHGGPDGQAMSSAAAFFAARVLGVPGDEGW